MKMNLTDKLVENADKNANLKKSIKELKNNIRFKKI